MSEFGPSKHPREWKRYCVYDIETLPSLREVYLVGFYDGKKYRYWESKPLSPDNPQSAISAFCNWFFYGPRRCRIYAHNGGNFDHLFVLRWILSNKKEAKIELIPVQSSILLMTIHLNGNKYEFCDSYRLIPAGLDAASKVFLGHGKLTNIDYTTLHTDKRRYEYLERDCRDLYNLLEVWRNTVEDKLQGSNGLTVAATAIETLRRSYLKTTIKQPSPEVEKLVREGYYGGRTEVYRTGGDFPITAPLRCYDINSLYPWAMSQPQPIEVICYSEHGDYRPWLCGFIECNVNIPFQPFPLLPHRQNGKLIFPIGKFRGVWSTIELARAQKYGAMIYDIGRSVYFRSAPVFSKYVQALYQLRDKSRKDYNETLSKIAKLLLNATYGKFGTNRAREKLWIKPPLAELIEKGMRPLQGPIGLPVFVEDVQCDASYILPHISAWVTALARIRLHQYLVAGNPNNVYYTDTDSIYTTDILASSTKLGDMKEEYRNIVKARFVAPKIYELTLSDGKIINRAKGFSQFGQGVVSGTVRELLKGKPVMCSAMVKLRTVIRGDFGLILRNKQLRDPVPKRNFATDGTRTPLEVRDE